MPAALVAAMALAGAVRARADGASAVLEPGYTHSETQSSDQAGHASSVTTDTLTQRYRLSLSRSLTDQLSGSVDGSVTDDQGWARTNGVSSEAHARSTLLGARLMLGGPVLGASVGADRREQQVLSGNGDSLISDNLYANADWHPLELPDLQLRLAHVDTYDRFRATQDGTSDTAQFSVRYGPSRFEVRYLLAWGRSEDHLHGVESTGVTQTVTGNRSDTLANGRIHTYVSANAQLQDNTSAVTGAGGVVTQQQVASTGLSAVVALPATPDNVALAPNGALIDGVTSAGSGVNLGWSLAASGDRNAREVGGGFANGTTDVNTLYVWFDRSLSTEVATAIAGTAQVWASDDNQRWTTVALASAPVYAPLQNRIELSIAQTHARYLKVDLRPIAATVTTDPAFRDVFVSEVQFLLVLPAALVPRHSNASSISGTWLLNALLLRKPSLNYDFSGTAAHQEPTSRTTYDMVNGLSLTQQLLTHTTGAARVARRDASDGVTHLGRWEWTAGLSGVPIPTVTWSVSYSGNAQPDRRLHSLSAFLRADLYEGISTQGNASVAETFQGERSTQTLQAGGNLSFAPNRSVTFSGAAMYNRAFLIDPVQGTLFTQSLRVDGSVYFTPTPAIVGAATISHTVSGPTPSTYATMYLNYSPLTGELQLTVAYSRTLDAVAEATTSAFTPGLRWNVRPGVTLNGYYQDTAVSSPVQESRTRTVGTNLLIAL